MTASLTVLYDNTTLDPTLESAHGFSCLLQVGGRKLLFDTGWDGELLLRNARRLGLSLADVEAVVISHDHWDHIGGLARVLAEMARPRVYLPASCSRNLQAEIGLRAQLRPVDGPCMPLPGCNVLGPAVGPPDELALVVRLASGVALITGCAHPGLGLLLALARSHGAVALVLGGFHGFSQIEQLAEVPRLLPCHCTAHLAALRTAFPDRVEPCGVGLVLELP